MLQGDNHVGSIRNLGQALQYEEQYHNLPDYTRGICTVDSRSHRLYGEKLMTYVTCSIDGCVWDTFYSFFKECPVCRLNRIMEKNLRELEDRIRGGDINESKTSRCNGIGDMR